MMQLSELKAQIDALSKQAKRKKIDPEVRMLVMPNFPVALSLNSLVLSTLDSSLSKETRGMGDYIYLAENRDEGAVAGEITERFGWDIKRTYFERLEDVGKERK